MSRNKIGTTAGCLVTLPPNLNELIEKYRDQRLIQNKRSVLKKPTKNQLIVELLIKATPIIQQEITNLVIINS